MGKIYSIDIDLNIPPTKNSITKFLQHTHQQRASFKLELFGNECSLDTAIKKLLSDLEPRDAWDANYDEGILITYQGTCVTLFVFEVDGKLKLSFLASLYFWYLEYQNEEYFDFSRYLKLFLELCEGLPIAKIETCTDD